MRWPKAGNEPARGQTLRQEGVPLGPDCARVARLLERAGKLHRPETLRVCVDSIFHQTRMPDEMIDALSRRTRPTVFRGGVLPRRTRPTVFCGGVLPRRTRPTVFCGGVLFRRTRPTVFCGIIPGQAC